MRKVPVGPSDADDFELPPPPARRVAVTKTEPKPVHVASQAHADEKAAPEASHTLADDMRRIIESVFVIDYKREWERLHEDLTVGENRGDYDTIRRCLDAAEDNALKAHKLAMNVKLEFDRYKMDLEATQSAMRSEASEVLEAEKAAGERKKSITEADVRAKMVELHPDEFRSQELEVRKFELTVRQAEKLSEVWSQKSRTLNAIIRTMRRIEE